MSHHNLLAQMMVEEGGVGFTARTVVFDCANNHGDATFIGIRSIDFYSEGVLLDLVAGVDFTAVATSYHNNLYVPQNAFATALSKVDSWDNTSWLASAAITNMRLQINFAANRNYDAIVVNNSHQFGVLTTTGVKDAKIYNSPTPQSLGAYGSAVTDGVLIYDDVFLEHVAANVADPQILVLT